MRSDIAASWLFSLARKLASVISSNVYDPGRVGCLRFRGGRPRLLGTLTEGSGRLVRSTVLGCRRRSSGGTIDLSVDTGTCSILATRYSRPLKRAPKKPSVSSSAGESVCIRARSQSKSVAPSGRSTCAA